jgi:hypothetical protein
MKLDLIEKIILRNKKWFSSKRGRLIIYMVSSTLLLWCLLILTFVTWHTVENHFRNLGTIFFFILLAIFSSGFGFFIQRTVLKVIKEDKAFDETITTHQTENLQEYENIRTQFTLHNIKNAVINANNYMDILRKGKMDLSIATENIQSCLDRIDEILEVFKDSDYAQNGWNSDWKNCLRPSKCFIIPP